MNKFQWKKEFREIRISIRIGDDSLIRECIKKLGWKNVPDVGRPHISEIQSIQDKMNYIRQRKGYPSIYVDGRMLVPSWDDLSDPDFDLNLWQRKHIKI